MALNCISKRYIPECRFAIDFVIFMMDQCYPEYEWKPCPDFLNLPPNSPLTPAIKNAIKQIFIRDRFEMHSCFYEAIELQGTNNEIFAVIAENMVSYSLVYERPYDCGNFLKTAVSLCSFAARSYLGGADAAPDVAMSILCKITETLICAQFFTWAQLNSFSVFAYSNPEN